MASRVGIEIQVLQTFRITSGTCLLCFSVFKYATSSQNAATLGATTGGILAAVNQAYSINSKYEAFMTEINNLQADLNILRNKIKAKYPVLDNLNETCGDLNVV